MLCTYLHSDSLLCTQISVDLPKTVSLSEFSMSYGAGFLEIAVKPTVAERSGLTSDQELGDLSRLLSDLIKETFFGPSALKCPDISGAHQDGCI